MAKDKEVKKEEEKKIEAKDQHDPNRPLTKGHENHNARCMVGKKMDRK